jgi:hypothetical protein
MAAVTLTMRTKKDPGSNVSVVATYVAAFALLEGYKRKLIVDGLVYDLRTIVISKGVSIVVTINEFGVAATSTPNVTNFFAALAARHKAFCGLNIGGTIYDLRTLTAS